MVYDRLHHATVCALSSVKYRPARAVLSINASASHPKRSHAVAIASMVATSGVSTAHGAIEHSNPASERDDGVRETHARAKRRDVDARSRKCATAIRFSRLAGVVLQQSRAARVRRPVFDCVTLTTRRTSLDPNLEMNFSARLDHGKPTCRAAAISKNRGSYRRRC